MEISLESPALRDARVLMSLVKVRGIRNRKALELFSATTEQRNRADPWEYFRSLALLSGAPQVHEWPWEQSGLQLQNSCDAGIRVIPYFDDDYPDRLRQIDDPPVVLFSRGEAAALRHSESVAIVGTREPTRFGEQAALDAGRMAAEAGITVVSGLALGCDTKAHEGCVELNGVGIAVLANGLDRIYPAANKVLASRILDGGGCLVTENPIGARLTRWAFAYRDRIQSGLSARVLVIETDVKGGTMHTVKFSRKQQRPLGCIDHPQRLLSDGKTRGNQMLIAEGAAARISDKQDLLNFLTGVSTPCSISEVPAAPSGKDPHYSLEARDLLSTINQDPVLAPDACSDSNADSESIGTQARAARPPTEGEQLSMQMEHN